MMENIHAFSDAICSSGLEPPAPIIPGKLHRFPGIGKHSSNRAGWCLLFEDSRGGSFGDWSSGFTENWQAEHKQSFSREERVVFCRKVAAAKAATEAARLSQQRKAAVRAAGIWSRSTAAPYSHPYLLRKSIQPHGTRVYHSALVLPVVGLDGTISTLQFIADNGEKRLLSNGQKSGYSIPVNGLLSLEMVQPQQIVICEGWATGATLAEDEPAALVLAAIDAGNLKAVALSVRQQRPEMPITIAGDDDRLPPGNPGRTKATDAAIVADAQLAFPQWPDGAPESLSDFNDLACWVKQQDTGSGS
ncbi:MAG: topoisomerase [Gammaproteobacteria bacterium]|nr:topoisomerase [Gammaproteobacteria bacterium]